MNDYQVYAAILAGDAVTCHILKNHEAGHRLGVESIQEPALQRHQGAPETAGHFRWAHSVEPVNIKALGIEYHGIGRVSGSSLC